MKRPPKQPRAITLDTKSVVALVRQVQKNFHSCERKHGYTKSEAWHIAYKAELFVYRCPVCHRYHISQLSGEH